MTSGTGATCRTFTPSARPDSASSARPLRYSSGSTSAGSGPSDLAELENQLRPVPRGVAACTAATALRMIRARSASLGSSLGSCSAA